MNSTNPTISIIIPIYNTEKYLRRCLDSIVAQTYKDFECILVDDGSTDGSDKICDEYAAKDKRFKSFHNENHGVGYTRNFGIDRTNGEFISFVDSDDWLNEKFYERLIPEIEKSDLVYLSDIFHYSDNTIVTHQLPNSIFTGRNDIEKTLLYLKENNAQYPFFGFTWNKIFKANIIKDHSIKFIENLTICEDEIFTDEYCKYISSLTLLSDTLYNYKCDILGLTKRKKNNFEFKLLINGIKNNIEVYSYKPLVKFEYERICYLLSEALINGGTDKELKEQFFQLKTYSQKYNIYVKKRLQPFIKLGSIGWLLFKLFRHLL